MRSIGGVKVAESSMNPARHSLVFARPPDRPDASRRRSNHTRYINRENFTNFDKIFPESVQYLIQLRQSLTQSCMLKFFRSLSKMKPPVNTQSLLHDVDTPTKKATFGMGCFWSNDSLFGATPGVVRTRVGYSGGTTKNPHYRSIGDHTEVIELDFDPKTLPYEELLDMFWANHEYGLTTKLKRQYQSMILYHDEEQRQVAEASYKEMQERCKGQLRTEIAPAGIFYAAEDYHQKYRLQGHKDLCRSLGLDSSKLQTSHLAARLNGYLVGVGGKTQFEQEVARLGLSEKQAEYVRRELERNEGGGLAC